MKKQTFILFLIFCLGLFLRIYKLDSVPISLHGDEIGVGYNAYTLATYGLDEYGKPLPIVFRADVGPIIFYATAPSVALFGLTEFATRIPSVIVGTMTIVAFYCFIKELLFFFTREHHNKKDKYHFLYLPNIQEKIALIASLLLSVSPWHVQISRITHDASYGLLLQILGMSLFFLYSRRKDLFLFYSAILFFGISFYAYHAPRLTSPLLLVLLASFLKKKLTTTSIIKGFLLFTLIILPLVFDFISKPLGQTRFGGINVFIGGTANIQSFLYIPVKLFLSFLNQFNIFSLYFDSSNVRYFNVQNVGLLPIFYVLLVPLAFLVIKSFRRIFIFILFWLILSVLPGALTLGPVNAGRIVLLFPLLEILSAIGVYYFLMKKMSSKPLHFFGIALTIFFFVGFFLNQYFNDSPKRFAKLWQYGTKEVAQIALTNESTVDRIVISDQLKQAYVYILYYGKKSPQSILNSPSTQKHSFVGYSSFEKYEFRDIDWNQDKQLKNMLFIGTLEELPLEKTDKIVTSPTGETLYISKLIP